MAITDGKGFNMEPKEFLTYEEMQLVKAAFLDVFNDLADSYVTPGDQDELARHLGIMHADVKIHRLMVPSTIEFYNNNIFVGGFLRDLYLELTDRFCSEITPIGKDVFKRLVHTLAKGLTDAKAQETGRSREIDPITIGIGINFADTCTRYFENPWLVALSLLARWFKKTTLGRNMKFDTKEPKQ